jgi:hypothetical protein
MRPALLVTLLASLLLAGVPASAQEAAGPVNTAVPTVSGVAREGLRLTAAPGTWVGSGTISYAYQWFRCNAAAAKCSSITGAKAARYRLGRRDVGATLGLTVRATDPTGATAAYASVVGPIARAAPTALASTVAPTVLGAAIRGSELRATAGTWSRTPTAVAYAWQRCNANGRMCAPVAGAVSPTYTATEADVGRALVAVVRASLGNVVQRSFSRRTLPVKAEPGPTNVVRPAVTGTARQGEQLRAAPGTWVGAGTISYAYQWFRCNAAAARCSSISGAKAATYRLVARDAGNALALTVRATDTSGTATAYASAIGVVARPGALASTAPPTLTGTAEVGGELTAATGTWTATPSAHAYAWHRCNANGRICVPIAGATSSTYAVTAEDVGHALVAHVRATAAGASATALSGATAPVVP